MAKVLHTCTGCVPIDASIIDTYVALVDINGKARTAEDERKAAETARESAEAERTATFAEDHSLAAADHAIAGEDHITADADHGRANYDHLIASTDHNTAAADHAASESATARANEAAAEAEEVVERGRGPVGPPGPEGAQGEQGVDGEPAGFGSVTATIGTSTGTPSVTVTVSGPDTAKNFLFAFDGLKGATGSQGNSGYSGAAGELEVVNNLTDGGATAALSAEMGKELGEILGIESGTVTDATVTAFNVGNLTTVAANIVNGRTYKISWAGATPNSSVLSVSFGSATDTAQTTALNQTTLTTADGYITVTATVDASHLRIVSRAPVVSSVTLSHEANRAGYIEELQSSMYSTFCMTGLAWKDNSGIRSQNGTIYNDTNAIACRTFLPLSKFSFRGHLKFKTDTNDRYYFVVALYSSASESGFLGRIGFTDALDIDWFAAYPAATHFRLSLVYKDGTGTTVLSAGIADEFNLQDVFILFDSSLQDVSVAANNAVRIGTRRSVILHKKLTGSIYAGQGFCKYGAYWLSASGSGDSFDTESSGIGYINIYDASFVYVGRIVHKLGHFSCLSYCEKRNVFISSNGDAGVFPRLDILLDASGHIDAAIAGQTSEYIYGASDVISIPLHTSSRDLVENGDAGVWCYGGDDRFVYISVRDSKTAVRKFFKGILGVGSADFTVDGGWGSFLSGKTSAEYNGTLKIVESYDGENITSAQGIDYYNGRLVLTSGTTEVDINILNLFGHQYQIVGYFKISNLADDGTESQAEPEDLTVVDGRVFVNTTMGMYEIWI